MYNKKIFIIFEGIEGSGKSFHSKNLANYLRKKRIPFIHLREPGGTKFSEKIRKLILNNKNNKLNPLTDTFLYLAARNENFLKNIKPFYRKKVIICDRFIDSTIAYQSYGMKVNKNLIIQANKLILKKIKPDFTFLLNIPVVESFQRLSIRKKLNRYDKFKKKFYKDVQSGFLKLASSNKKRYLVLNSSDKIEKNKKIIFSKTLKLLK